MGLGWGKTCDFPSNKYAFYFFHPIDFVGILVNCKNVFYNFIFRREAKVENQSYHQEDSFKLHQLIVDDADLHRIPDICFGELCHEVRRRSLELCDGILQVSQRHVVLLEELFKLKKNHILSSLQFRFYYLLYSYDLI